MFKKIAEHLEHFKMVFLISGSLLLLVAGLSSYNQDESFYSGSPKWLMASVLAAPKPTPLYTRGEFVIDVVNRMKKGKCFKDLCADMKGGMPDEKARCNLEKRNVYDKLAGYTWYDETLTRAEAIKVLVLAFNVPVDPGASQPFKDVPAKAWFKPFVAAAVKDGLIKDNATHKLKPNDNTTSAWTKQVLRKADVKAMCEAN